MVRQATKDDYPELLRMGEEFFRASGYASDMEFGVKEVTATFDILLDNETLLIGEGAMLGFLIFPVFMAKETLMSQELFWWVDKDRRGTRVGLKMLSEMERIAKSKGAKMCSMLCLDELSGDRVATLYKRLDYKPKERTYMKVL